MYLNPDTTHISRINRPKQPLHLQKRDWAHVVDITKPMPEYEELKESGGLAKEVSTTLPFLVNSTYFIYY